MIDIKNLTKMFDKESGINNLTLSLNKGIYGLLGVNGSGKSTLLKLIANLTTYKMGEIEINGVNIKNKNFNLEKVGFIGAERDLPSNMAVYKVFKLARELNKTKNDKFVEIARMLEINIDSHKLIGELSTGMIQKLKICLVFGYERDIYLLDEITLGLDPISTDNILNFIKNIAKGKLIIYSSHNLNEIELICDEVLVLKEHTIKETFKVADAKNILQNYKEIYQNNNEN